MTKITYIGHASLFLENDDIKLLQDPWIEGPGCFNSWYHFPRSVPVRNFNPPTHIYVSHSHQDHLSKETMAKFDKKTKIIIADVEEEFKGQPPVKDQIRDLGFKNITQLKNFQSIKIGKTTITIFISKYDSGICIQDRYCTVLNANDCPIEPLMGKIKAKFTPIDIAFMLPTAASHYPQCYTFEDTPETRYHSQLMSIARFIQRTIYLRPRVVVPYACTYAHFIEELDHLKGGISPKESLELMKPFISPYHKLGPKINPILMNPGDYWSSEKGHHKVSKFDWTNLEKEYQQAKKFYKKIIDERMNKEREITYTSTFPKSVEIKIIKGPVKAKFKTDFEKFIKKLFTLSKNDDFKIQFDFDWYKPIIDFKKKKIIDKNSSAWDVRFKVPSHLFNFFLENPPEWGNVLQSYRVKIDIKKVHRQSEYTFQKYMLNADSLPK